MKHCLDCWEVSEIRDSRRFIIYASLGKQIFKVIFPNNVTDSLMSNALRCTTIWDKQKHVADMSFWKIWKVRISEISNLTSGYYGRISVAEKLASKVMDFDVGGDLHPSLGSSKLYFPFALVRK